MFYDALVLFAERRIIILDLSLSKTGKTIAELRRAAGFTHASLTESLESAIRRYRNGKGVLLARMFRCGTKSQFF